MEKGLEDSDVDEFLKTIYFDPKRPGAFSGLDKLYREVKKAGEVVLSKGRIRKWLSKQDVYTNYKSVKRKFQRQRVVVPRRFHQLDGDTRSMIRYQKDNNGYKYVLVLIDILSRFAWVYALKSLTGK